MEILEKTRIVLVQPTHPGNIGAVARSMKTMGLSQLVLVRPKKFPHPEASNRAVSAEDVLDNAVLVDDVATAINDCSLVLGTSVRDREVAWPTVDPRQAASTIHSHLVDQASAKSANVEKHRVAILFGRESSGLSNAELDLCEMQIRVPANSEYSSLNLASAVQIVAYELRMNALLANPKSDVADPAASLTPRQQRQQAADSAQRVAYIEHLQEVLEQLDFIHSKPPTMLMRKLTKLYNKAQLTVEEVQILRGILTAMQTEMQRSADKNEN